jgi:ElaB/YqjD/DUF883 family membrane-anchored ribosome-binding protein
MAEERTLGTARAPEPETADDELTKADLQRRMDEARESITQTVTEIKDTVTTQYQNVRESISQSLDWREQYRRRPVEFTVAALGVGLLLGYSVGGAFGRDSEMPERFYESEGDDYDLDESHVRTPTERTFAPQAILGGAYGSTASAQPQQSQTTAGRNYEEQSSNASAESRPSYSSGYEASSASNEPAKPGLFDRFKETPAYDRLQAEAATLGNRFVEELSKTAQAVVLPALLGKLKDLIGIDLSTQREGAQRSRLEQPSATTSGAATTGRETGSSGSV